MQLPKTLNHSPLFGNQAEWAELPKLELSRVETSRKAEPSSSQQSSQLIAHSSLQPQAQETEPQYSLAQQQNRAPTQTNSQPATQPWNQTQ